MRPHLDEFIAEVKSVEQFLEDDQKGRPQRHDELTIYQKKLLELDRRMDHYLMLAGSLSPPPIREDHQLEDMKEDDDVGEAGRQGIGRAAGRAAASGRRPVGTVPDGLGPGVRRPGDEADAESGHDRAGNDVIQLPPRERRGIQPAVEKYTAELAAEPPADANLAKVGYEAWFDHFEPFYWALYFDLTAFTLVVVELVRLEPAFQSHRVLGAGADASPSTRWGWFRGFTSRAGRR